MTNKYFSLKKANRLRMTFVSNTSQSQIKEVVRYLKRVSWDFCGIELLYSDLIDMAIEANKNGQELFIRTNMITISAGASGLLLSFCSAVVSCIMPQKASSSKTFCHKLPDFT